MAKKQHFDPDLVIAAAMDLAAQHGWRGLALADIALHAHMGMAELVNHFPSKTAILDAYAKAIDERMMAGPMESGEGMRDRLFDVMMRRFEAMAPDRHALSAILRDTATDPWAMACGALRFGRSMMLTLETAGISTSGVVGIARIKGLAAIHLYVLKTFLDDDSPDLSRTMTALDKALRKAEDTANTIWRCRSRPSPHRETGGSSAPS